MSGLSFGGDMHCRHVAWPQRVTAAATSLRKRHVEPCLPVGVAVTKENAVMFRTLALFVVGYAAYRIGREFIASVPSDFDPVPAAPKRRRKPVVKPSAKTATATTH
jgi:hypothetical protein